MDSSTKSTKERVIRRRSAKYAEGEKEKLFELCVSAVKSIFCYG